MLVFVHMKDNEQIVHATVWRKTREKLTLLAALLKTTKLEAAEMAIESTLKEVEAQKQEKESDE